MRTVVIGFVLLALAAGSACGVGGRRHLETAADVASLIRETWGRTTGSPAFAYSCTGLDDRGRLFTCLAKDGTDTVRLASFDVVCDGARCTWADYPAYTG